MPKTRHGLDLTPYIEQMLVSDGKSEIKWDLSTAPMSITTVARRLRDEIKFSPVEEVRSLRNRFKIAIQSHDTLAAVPKEVLVFKLPDGKLSGELTDNQATALIHVMEATTKHPLVVRFNFPSVIFKYTDEEARTNFLKWCEDNKWKVIDKEDAGIVLTRS